MLLLNASGCLDALTAPDVARAFDAFVTKTVTPLPREGNAPPRIAETEHGMLNAIGLANPGRDAFVARVLPQLRELGVPLWVSVGGFAAHEYAETCAVLDAVTIELNLSCPNVDEAPESAAAIVAACREATANPLYAKLSPHSWDIGESVRAVEAAGADGVSLVNTLRGLALDANLQPALARGERDGAPDRRDGRRLDRARRAGDDRVRRDTCRTRHSTFCGSACTNSRAFRARRGARANRCPDRQLSEKLPVARGVQVGRMRRSYGAAPDSGTSAGPLPRSAHGSSQACE